MNPEILSATTISGTMVIGLAPIFLFWKLDVPKSSFYLSIGTGLIFGFVLVFKALPTEYLFTTGKYADLLTINVLGTIACFVVFFIPFLFNKSSNVKIN